MFTSNEESGCIQGSLRRVARQTCVVPTMSRVNVRDREDTGEVLQVSDNCYVGAGKALRVERVVILEPVYRDWRVSSLNTTSHSQPLSQRELSKRERCDSRRHWNRKSISTHCIIEGQLQTAYLEPNSNSYNKKIALDIIM